MTRGAEPLAGLRRTVTTIVVVALVGAVTVLGAWPVHARPGVLLAGGAALVAGLLAGMTIVRARLRALPAVGLALAGYLVVSLLAAVPDAWTALPGSLLDGLLDVVVAPVTGWKDLLTLALPAGDGQGVQLPVFIVVYTSTLLALVFALRTPRLWGLAPAVLALAALFPTVFGPRTVSDGPRVLGMTLPAPLPVVAGLVQLALLIGWAVARSRSRRVAASITATETAVPTDRGRALAARTRRLGLAAAMVVLAVVVAGLATAPLVGDRQRVVGRTVVQPETRTPPLTSPLSSFRRNFTADELHRTLLTVSGDAPQRLRLAALGQYDGEAFRTADPERPDDTSTAFARVPYRAPTAGGTTHTMTVTVDGYSGAWLPLAEQVSEVDFQGGDRRALAQGLYLNTDLQAGVELAARGDAQGLAAGDAYTVTWVDDEAEVSDDAGPGTGSLDGVDAESMPELNQWVTQQRQGGATVGEVRRLARLIIQRSYLGHSKDDPGTGDDSWLPKGYQFRASDAGHGRGRIDGLFGSMLDNRYLDCSDTVTQCAATVGDQEQYATATALMARVVGFPSRAVYGARVGDDGTVTGGDMTAWAEILTSDGTWVAIDTEPRTDNRFVENPDQNAYKRYSPTTAQQNAQQVPPPDKDPSGGVGGGETDDANRVWATVLHVAGVVGRTVFWIALVTLPVWGVLLYKALRWRRRCRHGTPDERLLAGWMEYVDRVVDAGGDVGRTRTRLEVAAPLGAGATRLAQLADWAAFAGVEIGEAQTREYWGLVDAERRRLFEGRTRAQRWRARLSLRSATGYVRRMRERAQIPRRFRLGSGRGRTR